jgi:predicted DNA-binding protein (UPF0278 family)
MLESAAEAFAPASVLAELKVSMLRNKIKKEVMLQVIDFIHQTEEPHH